MFDWIENLGKYKFVRHAPLDAHFMHDYRNKKFYGNFYVDLFIETERFVFTEDVDAAIKIVDYFLTTKDVEGFTDRNSLKEKVNFNPTLCAAEREGHIQYVKVGFGDEILYTFSNEEEYLTYTTGVVNKEDPVIESSTPNLKYLYCDVDNSIFIAKKISTTQIDQITTEPFTGSSWSYGIKNVYGVNITTSDATLLELGFVWVVDLQTYVNLLDKNIDLLNCGGEFYQQSYVRENSDEFCTCDYTGVLVRAEASFTLYDGSIACSSYYEENCFTCEDCGEIFPYEDHHAQNDICNSCYVPDIHSILRCYSTNPLTELGIIDLNGNAIYLGGSSNLYKAAKDMGLSPETIKDTYLGFEIEVEIEDHSEACESIQALHESRLALACVDTSLDDGCEFISPPVSIKYAETYLDRLFEHINEEAFFTKSTCGMHIHVSRKYLSELQIGRIFTFIHHSRNRHFLEKIAGRPASTSYARFNTNIKDAAYRLRKENVAKGREDSLQYYNNDRRNAVNVWKGHTVEFRLFAGTIDKQAALRYTQFVKALIQYTRSGGGYSAAKSASYNEFLSWLLNSKSSKREYAHLINFLQTVSYSKLNVREPQLNVIDKKLKKGEAICA